MRKRFVLGCGGLATAMAALLVLLPEREAPAADHGDSPSVGVDTAADIADLYAFVTAGNDRLALIQTVASGADATTTFSTDAAYVFNIVSSDNLLGPTQTANHQVIVTFDDAGDASVWVDGVHQVTGDASSEAGLSGGGVKIFAGLRDDPFFFNATGFFAVADIVNGAAGTLTFDSFGCPTLDEATATTLITQLGTEPGGGSAVDDFAGNNVMAIAIEVDLDLVNTAGDVLAVYAATHELQ